MHDCSAGGLPVDPLIFLELLLMKHNVWSVADTSIHVIVAMLTAKAGSHTYTLRRTVHT